MFMEMFSRYALGFTCSMGLILFSSYVVKGLERERDSGNKTSHDINMYDRRHIPVAKITYYTGWGGIVAGVGSALYMTGRWLWIFIATLLS